MNEKKYGSAVGEPETGSSTKRRNKREQSAEETESYDVDVVPPPMKRISNQTRELNNETTVGSKGEKCCEHISRNRTGSAAVPDVMREKELELESRRMVGSWAWAKALKTRREVTIFIKKKRTRRRVLKGG